MRRISVVFFMLCATFGFASADEPILDKAGSTSATAEKATSSKRSRNPRDDEYYELYKEFADTMDQVERNYVKDVSRRELMQAAIEGMLSKLDPYTNYISPDDLSRFKTSVDNEINGGIGIQISADEGKLRIITPLIGSPAYRAGLQAGDRILEIDGKTTEGIKDSEAVRRLKGEKDTDVTIVVQRGTEPKRTVTLKREVVQLETVLGDARKDDDTWDFMLDRDKKIGYVRLSAFGRETARELEKAVKALKKADMRGLVLDLRFNPGGLLTSAVEIADLFVEKGRIVSTSGRNSPDRAWEAREEGTYSGFPIVVLVNRYSASASEIVAACLQDHKRAIVVGERTWGKGSVQNVIELSNGKSALKLTTAGYLRPNGHNIDRLPGAKEADEWGVMPDAGYEVKLSDSEMAHLIENRRTRDFVLINHYKAEGSKPVESKKPGKKDRTAKGDAAKGDSDKTAPTAKAEDRQLQKALDYLSGELARAK